MCIHVNMHKVARHCVNVVNIKGLPRTQYFLSYGFLTSFQVQAWIPARGTGLRTNHKPLVPHSSHDIITAAGRLCLTGWYYN